MTFMKPTEEQRKMWRENKKILGQKLMLEQSRPLGERDDDQIEFLQERINHINNLLNPPIDEKNPAIN